MNIEIDKSKWSSSSQKSTGQYDLNAKFYENIAFKCYKCSRSCIFTAEEQKESYEVNKKHISRIPTRCPKCQKELEKLLRKDNEFQERWESDKESIIKDTSALKEWLSVIREKEHYGKSLNQSMVVCLLAHLNVT